ncbi:hypothetical protein [Arthrobacter koreensis]|uniref:hypothetical protein n=1 Tax=Arthrobacter koreensis TaxID=199136 RepID=UPI002DB9A715|nr:hypothetical protein [Arthrobacter koreensis]MEB7504965.1 hypothetical protein [Arthrobacter koreensis]
MSAAEPEDSNAVPAEGTVLDHPAAWDRVTLAWGIALGAAGLLLFGGHALLKGISLHGGSGQPLLFYLVMDESQWSCLLYVLGGICLAAAVPCLFPPLLRRIRLRWLRWCLKGLLAMTYLGLLGVWALFSLFLFFIAGTWSYSSFSDGEGHRALVRVQSYGVEIWTPYAGPLYQRFEGQVLTDMEAVTEGNCTLGSGAAGLELTCGRDTILLKPAGG